jgi:hypothetical protein
MEATDATKILKTIDNAVSESSEPSEFTVSREKLRQIEREMQSNSIKFKRKF